MNPRQSLLPILCLLLCLPAAELDAQNPWVLGKGQMNLGLGYSRKTGGKRWYPASIDTKGTPSGSDDTWTDDTLQDGTDLIDGKFHDFRYVYFAPEFGLGGGFEISALINYLDGWERITRDPQTNKTIAPEWEINRGFTDCWLRLKYQVPVKLPVALEFNTRLPDLYDLPGDTYTRYVTQIIGTDTLVEASPEWRGLGKRDFAFLVHAGNSFGKDYRGFVKGMVGYNIRQGAFADQFLAAVGAGFTFHLKQVSLVPNILVDYAGGLSNGKTPDASDRFQFSGRSNFYFNNSQTLRVYYSLYAGLSKHFGLSAGLGQWVWGKGAVKYTEPFVQLTYQVR